MEFSYKKYRKAVITRVRRKCKVGSHSPYIEPMIELFEEGMENYYWNFVNCANYMLDGEKHYGTQVKRYSDLIFSNIYDEFGELLDDYWDNLREWNKYKEVKPGDLPQNQ